MRTLLVSIALGLGCSAAAAQNLVRNGDFSQGTANWSFSGFAVAPGLKTFDTTGIGASQCYSMLPGRKVFTTPVKFLMSQRIPIGAGRQYELTADVASEHVFSTVNADGGRIDVELVASAGTQTVGKFWFGRIAARTVLRRRLCMRFVAARSGLIELRLSFYRNYNAGVGRTPANYIDNITLQPARDPIVCFRGERILGRAVTFEVTGQGNAAFAVFTAPKRLRNPIQVPGFTGAWYLDLATLLVVQVGALDASGRFVNPGFVMPNLPVLDKLPLWFQGVQAAAGKLTLGPAHPIGWRK